MSVVLGEATNASQAVKLATLLVTINRTELCATERQLLVGARTVGKYLAMVRAVHGLQQIFLAFLWCLNGLETVLSVMIPVT